MSLSALALFPCCLAGHVVYTFTWEPAAVNTRSVCTCSCFTASLTHPGSLTKFISIKQNAPSCLIQMQISKEWNLGRGQTWHRLSVHRSTTAQKQMLTAQQRQTSAKTTDRSVCALAGRFSSFISPEPRRSLGLTHSCCFSALATDKINCQPARMCERTLTAPLRIYALVSLKSCSNLCNCLAFVD